MRSMPSPREGHRYSASAVPFIEPTDFDDDDEITSHQSNGAESSLSSTNTRGNASGGVEVKTFPEVSAVPRSKCHDNFAILVHLKAPITPKLQDYQAMPLISQTSRASVDLVTVLDVSGSMSGII